MQKEIWKDVAEYEGIYQVSNRCRVKSLKRKGVASDRIMKTYIKNGYVLVLLTKNKTPKQKPIHRLIYQAFIGDLDGRLVVDHIDNDKLNNNISNLQQITIRENATKDRFRHNSSSNYLGVSWCKVKEKWRATIYDGKKRKHIGYYRDEIKASEAYQKEKEVLLKELNKQIKEYEA